MTVKIYQSTDADAPVLTGQAGTLVTVLDACLINGYSTRTISALTRSGSVATATTSAVHGLPVGGVIPVRLLIAGADQAEYNGEHVVTAISTNQYTFTVTGTPASPATGSITSKRPGLGWSKAFAGTNKAAYLIPAGGTQHYVQVLDDKTGSSQRSANLRAYEAMTNVDTGTGPFPTIAQQAAPGLWVYKSSVQDGSTRPWAIIGDERGFWLLTYPFPGSGDTSPAFCSWFGDTESYKAGDAYPDAIIAGTAEATTTGIGGSTPSDAPFYQLTSSLTTGTGGHFISRSHSQIGSAVAFAKLSDGLVTSAIGNAGMAYPNPVDNGYHVSRLRFGYASVIRGVMPGVYQPLHNSALTTGDTVTDVDGLPGRVLLITAVSIGSSGTGRAAFDVTGPWR